MPLAGWLGARSSSLIAAIPATLFVGFSTLIPEVARNGPILVSYAWVPSLDVALALRVDGLSLLFALLITGIGALIYLYASAYLRGQRWLGRFYIVLTLFMGAMLGAVLSDNLITLVVFWELTSITSFLLIGYHSERAEARRSAEQGFLITGAGGLALLAGAILLGEAAGTYSISGILAQGATLAAHPVAPVIILLIAAGAFTKSAQAPFHVWLANAMVAPTPVSAFLHSATMVKLGIYLLARFDPVLGGHGLWLGLLTVAGVVTMLTGAFLALRETDLKRLLAYSTIVSLGTLTMLVGAPGELAAVATVTFLVGHAVYKACLFMVAGIIDHETGVRDSARLGGLWRAMPITASVAALGALSMVGLPPFIGFAAKELVYETSLSGAASWGISGVALVANVAMIVVAGIIAVRCFMGERVPTPRHPRDPGPAMLAGPIVLALLGLVFGLAPWLAGSTLIVPAAAAIAGYPIEYTLSLWHGLTPMLLLSILTLALGLVAFRYADRLRGTFSGIRQITLWGPDRLYDHSMQALQRFAAWQTARIQSGSLRTYLGRTLGVLAIGGLATLLIRGGFAVPSYSAGFLPDLGFGLLLVIGALVTLAARNFVAGIVGAGMVGFSIALIFLFRGAPDLAFTQFSIEALSIVILLAIIGRLPFRQWDPRTGPQRLRDGAVAAAVGTMATCVMLAVLAQPLRTDLTDFYRAASVPEAHGRNLVNVILVDFRALDTLGEITVLGLAAIAAAAVITGVRAGTAEERT